MEINKEKGVLNLAAQKIATTYWQHQTKIIKISQCLDWKQETKIVVTWNYESRQGEESGASQIKTIVRWVRVRKEKEDHVISWEIAAGVEWEKSQRQGAIKEDENLNAEWEIEAKIGKVEVERKIRLFEGSIFGAKKLRKRQINRGETQGKIRKLQIKITNEEVKRPVNWVENQKATSYTWVWEGTKEKAVRIKNEGILISKWEEKNWNEN